MNGWGCRPGRGRPTITVCWAWRRRSRRALIEQRVQQRLESVRRYQMKHPEQATEAMNRLAQAYVCLTEPASKQAYDAALLGGVAVAVAEPVPALTPAPDALAWLFGPALTRSRSPSPPLPLWRDSHPCPPAPPETPRPVEPLSNRPNPLTRSSRPRSSRRKRAAALAPSGPCICASWRRVGSSSVWDELGKVPRIADAAHKPLRWTARS